LVEELTRGKSLTEIRLVVAIIANLNRIGVFDALKSRRGNRVLEFLQGDEDIVDLISEAGSKIEKTNEEIRDFIELIKSKSQTV